MFAFDSRTFEFCVLPFSISLAPHMFTRCMDTALGPLRREGICILNDLDDCQVCAHLEELCSDNVTWLLQHLEHLGLHLNGRKSRLRPSQVTEFPRHVFGGVIRCLPGRLGSHPQGQRLQRPVARTMVSPGVMSFLSQLTLQHIRIGGLPPIYNWP